MIQFTEKDFALGQISHKSSNFRANLLGESNSWRFISIGKERDPSAGEIEIVQLFDSDGKLVRRGKERRIIFLMPSLKRPTRDIVAARSVAVLLTPITLVGDLVLDPIIMILFELNTG
jgi:hypothetical protein